MWLKSQLSSSCLLPRPPSDTRKYTDTLQCPKRESSVMSNHDKFMAGFGPGLSSTHLSTLFRVESQGHVPQNPMTPMTKGRRGT